MFFSVRRVGIGWFDGRDVVSDHLIYIVQPYVVKPHRLVALPAQVFEDETTARRAGGRLSRYKAGVVVLAQAVDPVTRAKGRPRPLAVHGQVPEGWAVAEAA